MLIFEYSIFDSRFQKLANVLKIWNNQLSANKNMHLNNYSIYLMLIAFMQDQGLLPNLQAGAKFHPRIAEYMISDATGFPHFEPINIYYKTNTWYCDSEEFNPA